MSSGSHSEWIVFSCKTCGRRYRAAASAAGRHAKCRYCGARLTIPSDSSQAGAPLQEEATDDDVRADTLAQGIVADAWNYDEAIEALARSRNPLRVPALIKLLDPEVGSAICDHAAECLGRIGDRRAVEPLIATLGRPYGESHCRRAAASALAQLGEPRWEKVVFGKYDDFKRLASCGDPRVITPLIIGLEHGDEYGADEAAAALATLGTPRAHKALFDGARSGKRWPAEGAAKALGRMGTPAAVQALLESLTGSPAQAAVEALGKLKVTRAVHPLVALLKKEALRPKNPTYGGERCFEIALIEALGEIGDARAEGALREIIVREGQFSLVGRACVASLRKLGAAELPAPAPCTDTEHEWPFDCDSWQPATYDDWPTCKRCGKPARSFLDCSDLEPDQRTRSRSFRAIMRRRHDAYVSGMTAFVVQNPLNWQVPEHHWFTLDDPEHILEIPGGGARLAFPLLRMAGWALWWRGGTRAMRAAYGSGHGFHLDLIWDEIGMGVDPDAWIA